MNNKALKMVLALFFINSISLYFYFSSQPEYRRPLPEHRRPLLDTNAASESTQSHHPLPVKLWPVLPSYLPWSLNSNVRFRSCEAYFGNGYTHRVDVLKPAAEPHRKIQPGGGGGGGWFRCFRSETLRSSVCEGGRIRMIPEKIAMSHGGERLESVIGRRERDELPEFEDGAFQIEVAEKSRAGMRMVDEKFLDKYVERGPIDRHAMRELISSIRLADAHEFVCSKWIEEPTVLVTRFEYANLFHTVTDWYSAYVASRVTGLPNRPHLVFVDGHCETPLEETWRKLFSSLTYAKNFTGPVCFRRAILAPLGYENALFKGLDGTADCHGASAHDLWQNPDDRKTARLSEFGEMIRAAFGFPVDRDRIPEPSSSSGLNILFVRRENYLAHPRHRGKVQERLSNEQEVFDAVNRWAPDHPGCRVNVVNGRFAHMSMKEQVRAIQDALVIVGAHGAGLTHIVSATRNAVILEIISNEFRRPHFKMIAQWKGLAYHTVDLPRSYAEPRQVVEKLRYILRGIGC